MAPFHYWGLSESSLRLEARAKSTACFVRYSLQGYRFEHYLIKAIRPWFCCGFQNKNTLCKWAISKAHPSIFLWQMPNTSTEGDVHFPHTFSSNKGHRHNCFWEVLNAQFRESVQALNLNHKARNSNSPTRAQLKESRGKQQKSPEGSTALYRAPWGLCIRASAPQGPLHGRDQQSELEANKDTKNYLGKNRREELITKWGSKDNCPPSVHKIFWVLPPKQKNPDRSSLARRDLGTVEWKRKDSSQEQTATAPLSSTPTGSP